MGKSSAPRVFYELISSYTANQGVPSARLKPDFRAAQKELGPFGKQVIAFMMKMTVQYDKVAATMPTAAPYAYIFNIISQFTLKFGAFTLINAFDGVRLWHDQRRILGKPGAPDGSSFSDADATDSSVTAYLHVPLSAMNLPPRYWLDGSIPLACFDTDSVEIVLAGTAGAVGPTGFPGLTWDNVVLEFYAVCMNSHKCRIPTQWAKRTYTQSDLSFSFDVLGFPYYVDIFDYHPDATYPFAHSGYANVELAIDQGQLRAQSPDQLTYFDNLLARLDDADNDVATLGTNEFIPLVPPARGRYGFTKQPQGTHRLRIGTRTGTSNTVVQWHARGTRTNEWRQEMYRRLGIKTPTDAAVALQRGDKQPPSWMAPHLDEEIAWPGMPNQAAKARAIRKFPALASKIQTAG